jgi:hypothetical protein
MPKWKSWFNRLRPIAIEHKVKIWSDRQVRLRRAPRWPSLDGALLRVAPSHREFAQFPTMLLSLKTKWLLRCALCACLPALLCSSVRAQQTQTQEFPEIDTYVGLTDRYRLMFQVSRSKDGSTLNSTQFGPNLDINFRPLLRRKLRTNDSAKGNFLTLRIGYQYLENVGKPNENRVQSALTSRFHLPWSLELAERNRFDLRVISDQFSWRYRNRLTLERSFSIKSFSFSPYARGEIYYDSKPGTWNKSTYSFGAVIPIRKRFELEGYYERENTTGGSPPHVNGIGTTLSIYFRRKLA